MDCAQARKVLDAFAEGRAPAPEERAALGTHLTSCPACRGARDLLDAGLEVPRLEAPEGLLASILERTSGRACPDALALLSARAGGGAGGLDGDLLRSHLAACPDCDAVSRALSGLHRDLPALAALDPGPGFSREVLEAVRPGPGPLDRLAGRFVRGWRRMVLGHPRLAWEGAYLGLLVFLIAWGPSSIRPLAERPGLLLAETRTTVSGGVRDAAGTIAARSARLLHAAWDRGAASVRGERDRAAAEAERRLAGARPAARSFARHARSLVAGIRRADEEATREALAELKGDLEDVAARLQGRETAAGPAAPPRIPSSQGDTR